MKYTSIHLGKYVHDIHSQWISGQPNLECYIIHKHLLLIVSSRYHFLALQEVKKKSIWKLWGKLPISPCGVHMRLAVVSCEAHKITLRYVATYVHVRQTGYTFWLHTNCQNAHSSPTWQNNKWNPAAMYRSSRYAPLVCNSHMLSSFYLLYHRDSCIVYKKLCCSHHVGTKWYIGKSSNAVVGTMLPVFIPYPHAYSFAWVIITKSIEHPTQAQAPRIMHDGMMLLYVWSGDTLQSLILTVNIHTTCKQICLPSSAPELKLPGFPPPDFVASDCWELEGLGMVPVNLMSSSLPFH